VAPFFEAFRDALRASGDRDEPRIGLLTPGSFSETYFEPRHAGALSRISAGRGRRFSPSAATAFISVPLPA